MSSRIVVGGQYGSEGKGKVVAHYASQSSRPYVVRCGGPNSGHTVHFRGKDVVLRTVPAGIINPESLLFLAAGCAIDEAVLMREFAELDFNPKRLVIDPRVVLISKDDRVAEDPSIAEIASTGAGVGAALIRRMQRRGAKLVGDSSDLKALFRVEPVAPLVHRYLAAGGDVIIEGTQGFGLSLFHGTQYPYVTARDTNASGFASEVGLSPRDIDEITLVVRTFPIRVGGNSGPLDGEITWDEVARLSGAPHAIPEYTSVTGHVRRVANFDVNFVRLACDYNRPTSLALMGIDRVDFASQGASRPEELTAKAKRFVAELQERTRVPVSLVGTGFSMSEIIDISSPPQATNGHRAPTYAISRP